MATLTVQTLAKTGTQLTMNTCASGGDEFANDGKTSLWFKNANASARTLTIVSQATTDGLAVADRTVSILGSASEDTQVADLDRNVYNDTDGMVQLTYSTEVDLTVAVFKHP